MIPKEKIKKYAGLMMFENTEKDEETEYFSLTKHFFWRRDCVHLFAIQMDKPLNKNLNFKIPEEINLEEIEKIELENENLLKIKNNKNEIVVETSKNELKPNSLKTLYHKDFDKVIKVKGITLSKELTHFQRIVIGNKLEPRDLSIKIDLKTKHFHLMKEDSNIVSKSIPMEFIQGEEEGEITYPYYWFKELLANAQKYNSEILFKVNIPYFTVFQYEKGVYSVLTHKRDF